MCTDMLHDARYAHAPTSDERDGATAKKAENPNTKAKHVVRAKCAATHTTHTLTHTEADHRSHTHTHSLSRLY